jgi:hypothetical protein
LNALRLALVQEANSIDVDNVNFIQVQCRRPSDLLDFGAQINQARTSKFTTIRQLFESSSICLYLKSTFQRNC